VKKSFASKSKITPLDNFSVIEKNPFDNIVKKNHQNVFEIDKHVRIESLLSIINKNPTKFSIIVGQKNF
jgi:hypothetical protein